MAEETQKAVWERALGVSINFPEDDTDEIDVWAAFASPAPIIKQEHFHQAIDELPEIEAIIAKSLVHHGVNIWLGIPEHIIEELERAGYKISKTRKSTRQ